MSERMRDEATREIELQVGRRTQDGVVRLTAHIPQMLTLSVRYGAERAATVMLTHEQLQELQRALAALERLLEQDKAAQAEWDGNERRRPAA